MKKLTLILLIFSLIFQNCHKDNETEQTDKLYLLKITKNSKQYLEYKYSDSQIIYFKNFSDSIYKKWEFEYNSLNELTKINEYNKNDQQISRFEYVYNTDSLISSIFIYKINNGQESLIEEQKLNYDNENKLIKIDAYLPETFEYDGLDIIKHGKVSDQGIWKDFEYSYDNKNNVLSKIGMPAISPNYISKHNIDSVIANWTEYIDNMGIDSIESTKKHKDLIYSSIFEYNENGYPKIEYRNYSNYVDTIEYIYE